jgi:hypothetical protein
MSHIILWSNIVLLLTYGHSDQLTWPTPDSHLATPIGFLLALSIVMLSTRMFGMGKDCKFPTFAMPSWFFGKVSATALPSCSG